MQSNICLYTSLALAAANLVLGQRQTNASAVAQQLDGKLPSIIPSNFNFSGNVRTYYIQAEQVTWDYTPTGWDNVTPNHTHKPKVEG